MKRLLVAATLLLGLIGSALAQSTVNPSVPAQNAPLSSGPVRSNFSATYNDINGLLGMHAVSLLGSCSVQTQTVGADCLVETSGTAFNWYKYMGANGYSLVGTFNPSVSPVTFTPSMSAASLIGTAPINVTVVAGVATISCPCAVTNAANTFTVSPQTVQGASGTTPGWAVQIAGDTSARIFLGTNSNDVARLAFGPGNAGRDTFIERANPATIRFGSIDNATPVAQTLVVQNVVAGTSNTAGVALTINGSRGTGTGAGGNINFGYAAAGSSGTSQNALANLASIGTSVQGGQFVGFNVYPTANFNGNNGVQISQGTGPNGAGGTLTFWAQNGAIGSPTAVTSQQELGFIQAYGWTGSAFGPTGNPTGIGLVTTEAWTPTANGSGVLFQATPNGTTAAQNELSIQNGVTALAAAEFTKTGLGIGTINAENGLFDTSIRVLAAGTISAKIQNGDLSAVLSNTSSGTGAITYFSANNGTASGIFGIGGTGYTGVVVDVQNKAFALAGLGSAGFTLGTSNATPLDFVINNARVGGFTTGGVLQVGTDTVASLTATQTFTNKTLTSPIINVGSDATGDIYYRNAGVLTRLPIGTNGFVLQVNLGLPTWQPGSSAGSITVGSTAISSGANGNILFNNAGTLGNETITSILAAGTGISITGTTTATIAVSLSSLTNSLGSNPAIANGSFTDGPSVAQGTSGSWWASGTVTIGDSVANLIACKLWDGTTVIDSTNVRGPGTVVAGISIGLSGPISSPAANIRISCSSTDSTATFRFNDSGQSKDSTVSVHRLG